MEQITGNGKYQYNHAKKKQAKFKVGDVCYATHEKFVGLMRVEILKCNENSAMVKIIVCAKEQDEKEQSKLNDITIIPYKRMKKI